MILLKPSARLCRSRFQPPSISPMRALIALSGVSMMLLASCGVIADDNAATAQGTPIPVETVNALADDPVFASLLNLEPASAESVLRGASARNSLDFAIRTETIVNEAERWGLEVTLDPQTVASGLAAAGVDPTSLSDEALDQVGRQSVAYDLLTARFSHLGEPTEEDLRLIYEGAPVLWERTCMLAITAGVEMEDTVNEALESGGALGTTAVAHDGVEIAADPEEGCAGEGDLPPDLVDAVNTAVIDEVTGPVEISSQGQEVLVWFVVEERQELSFEEVRDDALLLAERFATQPVDAWIAFVMVNSVEVNPRYGGPVEMGSDLRGGVSARVTRPDAPPPVIDDSDPDDFELTVPES